MSGLGGVGAGGRRPAVEAPGAGGGGFGGVIDLGSDPIVGGRGLPDAGTKCAPYQRPASCDGALDCISDFRAVASRFPACTDGPSGRAYFVRCGAYDALAWYGIDTGAYVYFDRSDGHFAGLKGVGGGGASCESVDPSFEPPECESPPSCGSEDAGGIPARRCAPAEALDAGGPPTVCPVRAFPRTVPGTKPGAGDDPGGFTVKFVEGSHVRLLSERFVIAPLAMLDEDPQLLRCADLTAPQAVCDVEALDASLFQHPGIAVSRNSTRPEAELDRERAAGRADGGEYLGDLNLFYLVRVPFSELETVYDLFAHSPVVEAVYYNPITQP